MTDACESCGLPLNPQDIALAMREDGECWSCSSGHTARHLVERLSVLVNDLIRRVNRLDSARPASVADANAASERPQGE